MLLAARHTPFCIHARCRALLLLCKPPCITQPPPAGGTRQCGNLFTTSSSRRYPERSAPRTHQRRAALRASLLSLCHVVHAKAGSHLAMPFSVCTYCDLPAGTLSCRSTVPASPPSWWPTKWTSTTPSRTSSSTLAQSATCPSSSLAPGELGCGITSRFSCYLTCRLCVFIGVIEPTLTHCSFVRQLYTPR